MKKITALILGLSALPIASAQEYPSYGCPMGWMMSGSYGSGVWFFGWLFSLLLIGLVIAAIYYLIKSASKK